MEPTPFTTDQLSALLRFVEACAAVRPVGQTPLMTSDVAWQYPGSAPEENIRLWQQREQLAGYAWFQPPDHVHIDVTPEVESRELLLSEMLIWAERQRLNQPPNEPFHLELTSMEDWAKALRGLAERPATQRRFLTVSSLESDGPRIAALEAAGYRPSAHFEPMLTRSLADLPPPELGSRFKIRAVAPSERAKRVQLHRACWAPGSSFSAAQYEQVRSVGQLYEDELDLVAVAEGDSFASYTIAWACHTSKIGSFEPFGTHPDFRGSGVSKLVLYEGLRRLRAAGMRHARIYTACFNHQAAALYRSVGFEDIDTNRTFVKLL